MSLCSRQHQLFCTAWVQPRTATAEPHCSLQVTVPPGRYLLHQDVRMSGSNTELRGAAVDPLPVLIAAHPMCFIIEGTGHTVKHIEYQGNRKEGVSGVHVLCAAEGIQCFAQPPPVQCFMFAAQAS